MAVGRERRVETSANRCQRGALSGGAMFRFDIPFRLNRHHVRTPRWAHIETEGGTVRVSCDGTASLDSGRIRRLHEMIRGLLTSGSGDRIELDLRSVERADTTLLASLVELVRQARRAGVDLVIQASASVRDLVEVCRLDPLITD